MCLTTTRPDIQPEARFNVTQAAKALGVSRDSIYRWTKMGFLRPRFFKHSLRARYLGKDLLKFWEQDI